MNFRNWNIRTKLIVAFLMVGLVPSIGSNLITYIELAREVNSDAVARATLVAERKTKDVEDFFKNEGRGIVDLADNPAVINALEEMAAPFKNEIASTTSNNELISKYRSAMEKFYTENFIPTYVEKSGRKINVENIVGKLDTLSLAAQYDFIAANENPVGKKDLLVTSKHDTSYALAHTKYHTFFRNFLNRHGLYDLFLVNSDGRIVYSVFKEADFATSLYSGPWSETNLAQAFKESAKLPMGEFYVADLALYTPSYEAPASFAATPIYKNGKYLGSLITQLPIEKINTVVGHRQGLGERGEALLNGSDGKLRADTFRNKTTHTVASAFAPNSKIDVASDATRKAKAGENGIMANVSYDGVKTLAYYGTVKAHNLTWSIVTELDENEVFQTLKSLSFKIWSILLTCAFLIATFAFIFGNNIAKNLRSISAILNKSSNEVSAASSSSASSATELSEATTEQAASLQETMASVEEISAMVSQNAESASKTKNAVDANQKASEDGLKSVNEMLSAIGEIKQTNDEILTQMETSNKEFGEIVKIISEIGTKTNVINEIVFQTKLLSFNASVEAARAGEHGKGFAVVAEEVGNLAQMSGNAAKEIRDMLSDSIKKVNAIVEHTKSRVDHLIEVGKDKITMGQSTAQKCQQSLNEITENARSVASMITEITHASKEQAQGIQEINKAISQLDQVTQQNSAVAQQSSTQAEHLNSEANALSNAVSRLVTLVDGYDKAPHMEESKNDHHNDRESNRVIPLVQKAKTFKGRAVGATKKAVGSSVVPSSSDPNFEEF
ncbi:MAG: methyl-accepting chemotaxis protein [Bdellovibrionota bacterium]